MPEHVADTAFVDRGAAADPEPVAETEVRGSLEGQISNTRLQVYYVKRED